MLGGAKMKQKVLEEVREFIGLLVFVLLVSAIMVGLPTVLQSMRDVQNAQELAAKTTLRLEPDLRPNILDFLPEAVTLRPPHVLRIGVEDA